MTTEVNIQIPEGKKAYIKLKKSGLSTYSNNVWIITSCQNVIGISPGTMVPEQDILNLHSIPDLDIILEDNLMLEKINSRNGP